MIYILALVYLRVGNVLFFSFFISGIEIDRNSTYVGEDYMIEKFKLIFGLSIPIHRWRLNGVYVHPRVRLPADSRDINSLSM